MGLVAFAVTRYGVQNLALSGRLECIC
jgi:hypothetical protein